MICMEQGLLTLPGENDLNEQCERERDFLWERHKYRVIWDVSREMQMLNR